MATPSRIREVAFHMLFQMDAQGPQARLEQVVEGEAMKPGDLRKAETLAHGAFESRAAADAAMERFAPGWPAHRQPAVDRAILRLAFHELVDLKVAPAIAINEAVELAKEYSTERSPGFVNALLDRVVKEIIQGEDVQPVIAPEARPEAIDEIESPQAGGMADASSPHESDRDVPRPVPPLDTGRGPLPPGGQA